MTQAEAAPHTGDLAACYDEMRQIARRLLTSDHDRWLFQPTELAHEAAIRMLAIDADRFESRAHMLATAARITRRALIDEARASRRKKRQAPSLLTLWPGETSEILLEDLDEALTELAAMSVEHARIIELRFMLGMTVEEAAASEGIAPRTVKRRWAAARAWLQQRLEDREGG